MRWEAGIYGGGESIVLVFSLWLCGLVGGGVSGIRDGCLKIHVCLIHP